MEFVSHLVIAKLKVQMFHVTGVSASPVSAIDSF